MTDESARRRRLIENERLIRETNWEASLIAGEADLEEEEVEFYCACGRTACDERLLLTVSEYRAAHSDPHRFVVVPGHAQTDVEILLEHHPHYDVIEKRPAFRDTNPPWPS